ncbi:TetR/AcrR family transcriptional regulator [Gordonia sp. TBRC 11910]|uniref:TetR/AcrR family transcriptional regulator n=1 Tax=Gordonia asplenii TaxID=2725283 RepID=A0A848KS16_9ACTN|nr:WHG domain-containing protein [Gordonia asplenii]NMO01754.1 TetR/AcrR family transcriptional regulator [Gordonia asplenii]
MPRPRTRDADLARRFVDAAVTIVCDDGVGALTTRRASEVAGSNVAALNQLFGGREGLVDAVMADGFALLVTDARERTVGLDAEGRLREFARVYREFARRHPALIDVMFARPLSAGRSVDLAGALEVRAMLTGAVREMLAGVDSDHVDAAALGFGVLIEGLAMNERHGILGGPQAAQRVWDVAVDGALAGLRAGPR